MKSAFSPLNLDSPGIQEVLRDVFSQRHFLAFGVGSFEVAIVPLSSPRQIQAQLLPSLIASTFNNLQLGASPMVDLFPPNNRTVFQTDSRAKHVNATDGDWIND